MLKKLHIKILVLASVILLSSCMNDDALRDFEKLNKNETETGIFIVNEGNFMYSNASLSYYNTKTKEITNDIFYNTNGLPLGDVAQSMAIKDSLGYIVLNNSGKIYIININTFKYVSKITNLVSPRRIHFINDQKAYISDLYSKNISVYDPTINLVTHYIEIDNGNSEFAQHNSEMFVQKDNMVYVNSWSYDNKIIVINTDNDQVTDSITVGKQPNSMVLDKDNNLWVLSDGGFSGSSYGQENAQLVKINTQTNSITDTYTFSDIDVSPNNLCINKTKDTLYFVYGSWGGSIANKGIYQMPITNTALPQTAFINTDNNNVYGLNVNEDGIYFSDALNYSQNGVIYKYTSSGILVDYFKVGINPSSFCFKK